jgi:hypothetical protein
MGSRLRLIEQKEAVQSFSGKVGLGSSIPDHDPPPSTVPWGDADQI